MFKLRMPYWVAPLAVGLILALAGNPPARACNGLTATIIGTSGPDTINGTTGADVIETYQGDDWVFADAGADCLYAPGIRTRPHVAIANDRDVECVHHGRDLIPVRVPGIHLRT